MTHPGKARPLSRSERQSLGPAAKVFAAKFHVGGDSRKIHPVDSCGVALAGIQGLHSFVREQEAEIAHLAKDVARTRRLLTHLKTASRRRRCSA